MGEGIFLGGRFPVHGDALPGKGGVRGPLRGDTHRGMGGSVRLQCLEALTGQSCERFRAIAPNFGAWTPELYSIH
jgi:hypothetical protein